MRTKKKGRPPKYGKPITEKICDYLSKGKYSYAQISRKVGIHPDTFTDWLNLHPEFREAVEVAKQTYLDSLSIKARCALEKRVEGFYAPETRTVKRKLKGESEMTVIEETVTDKYVAPDTTAIIFVLTNTDPENWKNRHSAEVTGKDGKDLLELKTDEELDAEIAELKRKFEG
ncbi:MAG: hypothetical protein K2K92_02955 [Duncaniella sp.]|nr:hypothetical protein [Duncaniella sp.]